MKRRRIARPRVRRKDGIAAAAMLGAFAVFYTLALPDKTAWVLAACDYITSRPDAFLVPATGILNRACRGLQCFITVVVQLLRILPFMANLARAVQQVSASGVAAASPTFVARPPVLCHAVQRVRDDPSFSTSLAAHLVVLAYFLEISRDPLVITTFIEHARTTKSMEKALIDESVSARCHPSPL